MKKCLDAYNLWRVLSFCFAPFLIIVDNFVVIMKVNYHLQHTESSDKKRGKINKNVELKITFFMSRTRNNLT